MLYDLAFNNNLSQLVNQPTHGGLQFFKYGTHDLAFNNNLLQIVNQPTHIRGNALDLVFTNVFSSAK